MWRFFKARRIRKAQEARKAADRRLEEAVHRRDTRSIHAVRMALREATHALLRAEGR